MHRLNTKKIKIGNTYIGGVNNLVIQSMTTSKTSDVSSTIKQILELENVGCQIVRVSILDQDDAKSIKEIKKQIHIPLVADIHFDSQLALLSIENGADKIRINPGNFPKKDLENIVLKAKQYDIPIRIGVNYGSIEKELISLPPHIAMYVSVKNYVDYFESLDFKNIVISAKSSDINDTIEANKMIAKELNYPIHLGITEAGDEISSLVKSSFALGKLIEEGIGDTIRISINGDLEREVIAAKELLKCLNLRNNIPNLIACPTCGRARMNMKDIVIETRKLLNNIDANLTIAIMGCEVNGPGEAKGADIAICGGKDKALLFIKGQFIKKIAYEQIIPTLKEEINKFIN